MKIIPIILFLCSSHFLPIFSQNNSILQDPAAEIYLDALAKLFSPEKTCQIEFKYEIESKMDGSKVNDYGSVIIKGQKYKLKLEDGESYYNGEKLWIYNKEAGEVYVSIPDKSNSEPMLINPFRLLSKYKEYYKYQLTGESNKDGIIFVNIELYPKVLETDYSIIKLTINKKTNTLFILELQQKKGTVYKIYVNEIIPMLKVDDSAFSWDVTANPDVLEIEL